MGSGKLPLCKCVARACSTLNLSVLLGNALTVFRCVFILVSDFLLCLAEHCAPLGFNHFQDRQVVGESLGRLSTSRSGCFDACKALMGCRAASYEDDSKSCELKKKPTGVIPRAGFDSILKKGECNFMFLHFFQSLLVVRSMTLQTVTPVVQWFGRGWGMVTPGRSTHWAVKQEKGRLTIGWVMSYVNMEV